MPAALITDAVRRYRARMWKDVNFPRMRKATNLGKDALAELTPGRRHGQAQGLARAGAADDRGYPESACARIRADG